MLQRMKIGVRIKEARKLRFLSQGDLASRCGVTQPTVSDWENSRTEPTVDNMRFIAETLEICFEWLATGRGPRDYVAGVSEPGNEYRTKIEPPKEEAELLELFRKLKASRQMALLDFLKRW